MTKEQTMEEIKYKTEEIKKGVYKIRVFHSIPVIKERKYFIMRNKLANHIIKKLKHDIHISPMSAYSYSWTPDWKYLIVDTEENYY